MTALSFEELRSEEIELLPSRETLAFFNWANVSATNLAISQNTLHAPVAGARIGQPGRARQPDLSGMTTCQHLNDGEEG